MVVSGAMCRLGGGVLAWLCLERCADLHMGRLMPLPLTISCFSKIQIGFTFLVPAHPGSPGQRAVKRVCVCVCVCVLLHCIALHFRAPCTPPVGVNARVRGGEGHWRPLRRAARFIASAPWWAPIGLTLVTLLRTN